MNDFIYLTPEYLFNDKILIDYFNNNLNALYQIIEDSKKKQ
jgi:hypothetical protein